VNHDFMLPGNAAMARRLVRLSRVMSINLDPEIVALSETNLLTDLDFKGTGLTGDERLAVQSLIDFGFRAVLPSQNGKSGKVALVAARLAKLSPIFVMADRSRDKFWRDSLKAYGFEDFEIIRSSGKIDPDLIRGRRHGLLLVDNDGSNMTDEMSLLLNDFPMSVILCNRRLVGDVNDLIGHLFEGAPDELLTTVNPYFRKDLERRGFTSTRPEDLAFLFNVVTDMIAVTKEPTTAPRVDPDVYAELEREVKLGHLRLG